MITAVFQSGLYAKWGNNVYDVSELSGLTKLELLALGDNRISDITPLKNLTKLQFLSLTNNPVTRMDIDELAAALPNTDIRSNIPWWE